MPGHAQRHRLPGCGGTDEHFFDIPDRSRHFRRHYAYCAARGIDVSIAPIEAGGMRRTINGTPIDLTRWTHRKYRLEIECRDTVAPTLAALWRGQTVSVNAPIRLRQVVSSGLATLIRPAVPGSVRCFTADGTPVPSTVSSTSVSTSSSAAHVEYQPVMAMMVVERSEDYAEWGATTGWSIVLEEV
jgi:hypothetical protein